MNDQLKKYHVTYKVDDFSNHGEIKAFYIHFNIYASKCTEASEKAINFLRGIFSRSARQNMISSHFEVKEVNDEHNNI